MKRGLILILGLVFVGSLASSVHADGRKFTYSYEAHVAPEGELEFEQWITNENGKVEGDYSKWTLRSEIEYAVTRRWVTAGYLNFESLRRDGVPGEEDESGGEFKGVSWENTYLLLDPKKNFVGLGTYLEYSTDGIDQEIEGKLLISKPLSDSVVAVVNGIYEAEFEKEDGITEKEAEVSVTSGLSYKFYPKWSVGLEGRWKAAYPGGLDLNDREFQTVSVGPNLHYMSDAWWATLTVLPQVWGDGDGAQGGRNRVHEETAEVRLIFGVEFD